MRKSSKLDNEVISPRSSKNFYIADQLLKMVYLKTDSRSLYFLVLCRLDGLAQHIVVDQFESNDLIKAGRVCVTI